MTKKSIARVFLGLVIGSCSSFGDSNTLLAVHKESSPHSEALMLVLQTQQEVIREVERECPWWFDTMNREWIVQRPVAPGIIDTTHCFHVVYIIDGEEVASWSINTDAEDENEIVQLISVTPKRVPDLREEREKQAELIAQKMLHSQPALGAFTNHFTVTEASALYGWMAGVYFSEDQWHGDLIPKTELAFRTEAEVVFPVNTNGVAQVGIEPDQLMDALDYLCSVPFIADLTTSGGKIRLRAAGDRLHWDSTSVEEYILIMANNGLPPPPLDIWIQAIIDLPNSSKMLSVFHPLNSDFFVIGRYYLINNEKWRAQYQELAGTTLDESSPYIDKKYCPVVDKEGNLRLLERAINMK